MKQNSPYPTHCRHEDKFSRIHENMGHPSNRTLVRVLLLGGAKRRFILAAAKHSCGACEAQKRPTGPILSRSPNSFVFNDVVGLDLFFPEHVRKAHVACLPLTRSQLLLLCVVVIVCCCFCWGCVVVLLCCCVVVCCVLCVVLVVVCWSVLVIVCCCLLCVVVCCCVLLCVVVCCCVLL